MMLVEGKRVVLTATVFAASLASRSLTAQNRPVVIAILPFDDRGSFGQEKEIFRALRLGIPATIAGELSNHSQLRLADAAKVKQALRTLQSKSEPSSRLDATTAARAGREVGARYAITGSFADFYGKVRLEARVIDVESGQIRSVVANTDPTLQDRADLYRIVQQVGHKLLAQASPERGATVEDGEGRVIPTDALTQFSLGLLAESQGDSTKAARHYIQALSTLPDYREAREGLRRVGRS